MKGIENSECLHNRLKKIIGQVQAVDRAIDTDISCEDVITQINAAKSALHKYYWNSTFVLVWRKE